MRADILAGGIFPDYALPGRTGEMQAIPQSLPLDAWMTVRTTPLTPHLRHPALVAS
jgi:muconolactone delta-isomerase